MTFASGVAEVEALLGTRLRDMTRRSIELIVELGVEEDTALDFKREFASGAGGYQELSKDVCAFANARGGVIIFGIEETGGRAASMQPFEAPAGELRDRVAQVLRAHTKPVPAFDVLQVPDTENRVFVVLAIPRSDNAPHAVVRSDRNDAWFQFPIRHESTTRFMSEDEVASRYARRFVTRQERLDRLQALLDGTEPRPSYVTLAFASVPANVGRAEIAHGSADRWAEHLETIISARDSTFGLHVGQDVRESRYLPGGMRITLTTAHIDLFESGECFAQVYLDPFVAQSMGRAANRPAGVLDESLHALIGLLATVGGTYASSECGCGGDLFLRIALAATAADGSQRPLTLVESSSAIDGDHRIAAGGSCESVVAEATPSIETVVTTQGLMRTVRTLTSTVAQHFGLPESTLFTADGEVHLPSFSKSTKMHVAEWASNHSIPAIDILA